MVTANNREVLEETATRIEAFLRERGVSLSPEKTKITHISEGFDFLGQNIRKHVRSDGRLGKIQITPSLKSFQHIKDEVKRLSQRHRGASPAVLIEKLNPVLRGWANYHRHIPCAERFGQLDRFVWGRVYRWCKRRHPDKTGRWIVARYFLHGQSSEWRFTDPDSGVSLIKVAQLVKQQRHVKVRGAANPFDPEWEAYFEGRERKQALVLNPSHTAKVLRVQDGICPRCRQVIGYEEDLVLHHRDGDRRNFKIANVVYYHPNCYTDRTLDPIVKPNRRVRQGVCHA